MPPAPLAHTALISMRLFHFMQHGKTEAKKSSFWKKFFEQIFQFFSLIFQNLLIFFQQYYQNAVSKQIFNKAMITKFALKWNLVNISKWPLKIFFSKAHWFKKSIIRAFEWIKIGTSLVCEVHWKMIPYPCPLEVS